jgi:KDO2-lipid IV(A) lauroyltransferase
MSPRSRRKVKLRKLLVSYLAYYFGKITLLFAEELPIWLTKALMGKIFRLALLFLRRERKLALTHIEMALGGETTERTRKQIVSAMFENMGKNLGEFIALPRLRKSQIISMVDGSDYLPKVREALAKGRGLIIATGHLGNWELFAAYIASLFKLSVVARKLHFEKFDKEVVSRRRRLRMAVIYQSDGVRPIIRALKDNHIIGILLDQDIKDASGVFVDFFGRKALTVTAPLSIAQSTGTPVLPAAAVRLPDGRHKVIVSDFLQIDRTGDKLQDKAAAAQKWSTTFERFIREYPEQWVWFHRRWKTRPKNEH